MRVHARAGRFERRGDAEHVLQRMKVKRIALEKAAAIAACFQALRERRGRHGFPVDAEAVFHQPALAVEPRVVAEPVGEDHAGVGEVAVDRIARDARAHQRDGVGGERVQRAGARRSEAAQQIRAVEAVAAEHEAAVAARRAEADGLGVEHDDFADAALDEAERGGQSGEPAADHADFRALPAAQRRARRPAHGCLVVAAHPRQVTGSSLPLSTTGPLGPFGLGEPPGFSIEIASAA